MLALPKYPLDSGEVSSMQLISVIADVSKEVAAIVNIFALA